MVEPLGIQRLTISWIIRMDGSKILYHILATRATYYYPYVWSKSYCLLHESREAALLSKTCRNTTLQLSNVTFL